MRKGLRLVHRAARHPLPTLHCWPFIQTLTHLGWASVLPGAGQTPAVGTAYRDLWACDHVTCHHVTYHRWGN